MKEMNKGQHTVSQQLQAHKEQIFEPENNSPIPVTTKLQGTISLPFGERLITDHDSDEGFELSSEEQTDKNDSIQKYE